MNKDIENELVDACFPIVANLSSEVTVAHDDERPDDEIIEKITREAVRECIRVYNIKMEFEPQLQDTEVYCSFPIRELSDIKKVIINAQTPKVTFSDDFTTMKNERDHIRLNELNKIRMWIDKVLL